jgi:hypothetical protein
MRADYSATAGYEESQMIRKFMFGGAAIAVAATLGAAALAGANDYVFEPVNAQVKKGDDVIVSVRLKHKPSGKA